MQNILLSKPLIPLYKILISYHTKVHIFIENKALKHCFAHIFKQILSKTTLIYHKKFP